MPPLSDWPRGEPSGDELLARRRRILNAVRGGTADHEWCPMALTDDQGNRLNLLVSCDALKLDGVRVNVDAETQQRIADHLGALLLTPLLVDQIYRRSPQLPPSPQKITASVEGMIAHSRRVDALAEGHSTPPPLANVGKDWVLSKRLWEPEAIRRRAAANYGWLGTAVSKFPSVTGLPIIQNVGTRHSRDHQDYSQVARFVHRQAVWNETPIDLADTYVGDAPGLNLVSHEGALPEARMPESGTRPPPPPVGPGEDDIATVPDASKKRTASVAAGLVAGAVAGGFTAGPPGVLIGGVAGAFFGRAVRGA